MWSNDHELYIRMNADISVREYPLSMYVADKGVSTSSPKRTAMALVMLLF